jgi:hypothetical protein
MSKIHYFQRYSSIENTVTNNTLQLFARIYDYSTRLASSFLSELTGEPIAIGIEISQQGRIGNSVPDGAIVQRSFKILIEAKVDSGVNKAQLLGHANTFGDEKQKLLLLLTKQPIGITEQGIIDSQIRAQFPEVIFKNVTYEEICSSIKGLFKEHESAMSELVEDYVEYCNDVKLFDQAKFLMRVLPCSQSIEMNRKHGIYFHPSDRGYTPHAYIGIYANKVVQAILGIECVFDITLDKGKLTKVLVSGTDTNKFDDALVQIIREAKVQRGWEVSTGHRFFCGSVADTDFRKTSSGGIQGARLFLETSRI